MRISLRTRSRNDRSAPAAADEITSPPASGEPGSAWWGDASASRFVGAALVTIGLTALGGVAVGLGWAALAPAVDIRMGTDGLLSPSEAEIGRIFAREGVFALVTATAGLVAAVAGRSWVSLSGPLAVVVLVLAGLVGSVVAWRVGVWAGPDAGLSTAGMDVGDTVGVPLALRSKGLLLMWPIGTTLVTMWIAVLSVATRPDRSDDRSDDAQARVPASPQEPNATSLGAAGAQHTRTPGA